MRRVALTLLACLLLCVAGASDAGGGTRVWRIYAITYRGRTEVERGFADYLSARGIPVEIVYRDLALDARRLPGLVEEIRRERPDLVFTWGTTATLGIAGAWDQVDPARHITDIPIVFGMVAAPVNARLVPDLKSSGRNLTGVRHVADLDTQLKAMAAYRPFRRVGMLYTPTEPNAQAVLDELRALGRRQGFSVQARAFRIDAAGRPSAEGAAGLVGELKQAGAQWLYLPPDSFLNQQARDLVIPASLAVGLPAFASTEALMATGALAGLVSRYYNVGQFAAYKAEQILVHGMAPARIPVETLSRFSLQISLPVARRLGLLPPLAMFNYAEILGVDGAPGATFNLERAVRPQMNGSLP
jgi:putative ABC transport system substrate-binding protein